MLIYDFIGSSRGHEKATRVGIRGMFLVRRRFRYFLFLATVLLMLAKTSLKLSATSVLSEVLVTCVVGSLVC